MELLPADHEMTSFTISSALGAWTHTEWRPRRLAGVVERFWHFEGTTSLPRERTFPGDYLELIFQLGPLYREVGSDGELEGEFPHSCLTGLQGSPHVIEAPSSRCCVLGVRLTPEGAHALLGLPIQELTGLTVDLAQLGVDGGEYLAERCAETRSVSGRFRIVAEWVEQRVARSSAPPAAMSWALAELRGSQGMASIAGLQARTGMSKGRFIAGFRELAGTTPKHFARILRFRRALTLVHAGGRLSDIALTAGYSDQPHMNRDFREFAGMSPAELARSRRYPNSPSVAEDGAGE